MKKSAGPASRVIATVEAFNKFTSNENAVLVGKITDSINFSLFKRLWVAGFFAEGSDDLKSFEKVANSLRDDYVFGHVASSDLLKELSQSTYVVLRLA